MTELPPFPLPTRVVAEALVLVPKSMEGMEEHLALRSWEGEDQTFKNSMTIFAASVCEESEDADNSDELRTFLRRVLETPADRYIFMLESSPRADVWDVAAKG